MVRFTCERCGTRWDVTPNPYGVEPEHVCPTCARSLDVLPVFLLFAFVLSCVLLAAYAAL